MTRLSIVMPNYNQGHLFFNLIPKLAKSISSEDELIFIDDGSTDDSVTQIAQLKSELGIGNLHLYQNRINRGVVYTENKGANIARGDFLYFAAGDDDVDPDFFFEVLNAFKKHPYAGLASSSSYLQYPGGESILMPLFPPSQGCQYISPKECIKLLEVRDTWISGNSCIYRRSAFIEAGGFVERLSGFCDVLLALQIPTIYGAIFLPKPLTTFRLSKESYAAQHYTEEGFPETLRILNFTKEILEQRSPTQNLAECWFNRVYSQVNTGYQVKRQLNKVNQSEGVVRYTLQLFILVYRVLSSLLELFKAGELKLYMLRFLKIRFRLMR